MLNNELKQKLVKLVLPVVAIVAIVFAGYFYYQMRALKQSPQSVAQQETADLVSKISKLMVLPTGETPTFATVSNPALLKDQPFFVSAVKGDKVLIYTQAQKVILYSVTLNKILNVAPYNIETQTVTPPTTIPITTTPTTKKP